MYKVESNGNCGARLVAQHSFPRGAHICSIEDYRIVTSPTYQTIQIGPHQHLEELGVIAYMNHSCQPNTIIDTTTLAIYATRDIAPGDDLTFFYPSTEWEMARPFICLCGSPECVRFVAGARYLSIDVLSHYFVNRHIRAMVAAALAAADLVTASASAFAPHAEGIQDYTLNGSWGRYE